MMNNKGLFFAVLFSMLMMVLTSLGKGFWGGESGRIHWTEKLFYGICHQIPERSFFVNGEPMAVNSRCFGVFSGLLGAWVLIPVFGKKQGNRKWPIWLLVFAIGIQIIDYSGNLLQLWDNTNESRFILGLLLGISGPVVLADQFYTQPKISDKHGRHESGNN
jgi:uncharacterized membrane protein